jgi:ribosome biogenesis GTPase
VIFESREHFRVISPDLTVFEAKLSGNARVQKLFPAVGDYVRGRPQPGGWFLIEETAPRRTVLKRRDAGNEREQILAANVDILFIVTSANQDLNFNRVDRLVALADAGGVASVIVINKIELAQDPHAILDRTSERFRDIDVLGVSCFNGWNLDALAEMLRPALTVAFAGSSGVGKSSLTNALMGEDRMLVKAIREGDGRGRHTTTHRELLVAPNGAVIIDTPGLRKVGLTGEVDVEGIFGDLSELESRCRFGDCLHENEPGCAVRTALTAEELDPERWASFLKLRKEAAFEARKSDKALAAENKRMWVRRHKAYRQRKKLLGR